MLLLSTITVEIMFFESVNLSFAEQWKLQHDLAFEAHDQLVFTTSDSGYLTVAAIWFVDDLVADQEEGLLKAHSFQELLVKHIELEAGQEGLGYETKSLKGQMVLV